MTKEVRTYLFRVATCYVQNRHKMLHFALGGHTSSFFCHSGLSSNLFVKASLTIFMIALFTTTVEIMLLLTIDILIRKFTQPLHIILKIKWYLKLESREVTGSHDSEKKLLIKNTVFQAAC